MLIFELMNDNTKSKPFSYFFDLDLTKFIKNKNAKERNVLKNCFSSHYNNIVVWRWWRWYGDGIYVVSSVMLLSPSWS